MRTHWISVQRLQVGDLVSHYAYGIGLIVSVNPTALAADVFWLALGIVGEKYYFDSVKKIEAPSE